jgi:hypothetical protein
MRLGSIDKLREALGGRDGQGNLVVGETYAIALKKAAGMQGTRLFDIEAAVKWKRDHPAWKMTEVYPRRRRKCSLSSRPAAVADKSDAL